jgi:hypothetical protein
MRIALIPLPNDMYDHAAALHFGHNSDGLADFLVLIESEKVRQLWHMELRAFSRPEVLKLALERRVGPFRTGEVPTSTYGSFALFSVRAEQNS